MGENADKVVDVIKKFFKSWSKKLIIIVLIVVIIIIFLGASAYEIDGRNWKDTTSVAAGYTSNVTINPSGTVTGSTTSQELWDEMIEKDTDIEKYLDAPEELLKLMNAEVVTQFPDTREDPTQPIDWDSINSNVEESVMQGIIKFKRKDSEGNESIITYAEPYLFDGWIEDYNSTGDEESKKKLLSHFTIRQGIPSTTGESGGTSIVVTGRVADVTESIVNQITSLDNYGLGKSQCQAWVGRAYQAAGFGYTASGCCAYLAGTKWGVSTDFSQIVSGAAVWTGAGSYRGTQCSVHTNGGCGHAGIYYKDEDGNDWVMHLINGTVRKDTLEHWLEYYGKGNTPVWGWQGGLTVIEEEGDTSTDATTEIDTDTTTTDLQTMTETQTTKNNNYYVEVATWSEITDIIENKNNGGGDPDPDVEQSTEVLYRMTTTKINYQELTKGYTMPFEYLCAMLVISEDKDFVMDLADLVYDSEIEITVHDNLTTTTNVNKYTYTKLKKTETTAKVTATGTKIVGDKVISEAINKEGNWTDIEDPNYTTTYTTINKVNTLDISVTLADVWMGKYTKDYTNEVPADVVSNSENTMEDIPYPDTPSAEGENDTYGHAADLLESAKNSLENSGCIGVNGYINYVKEKIYYSTVDRKENITNTVNKNKYVASPMVVEEKIDKDSEEPNFVTIFLDKDNSQAKNYILDVDDWLYELLEQNESTVELVDLTKYLIYKATDGKYGESEFDMYSMYKANLTNVGAGDYIVDITKSSENIVIKDIETLEKAFAAYSGCSELIKHSQEFLDLQEEYKVNAIFAAAVSIDETSAGRNGHAIDGKNNWFNIECTCNESHGRYETYESAEVSIEKFFELISVSDIYFKNGKNSVKQIGGTYAEDPEWSNKVIAYMTQMFQAVGVELSAYASAEGVQYYQNDYRDVPYGSGTISTSGCVPTCFAMVATQVSGRQITPKDAVEWCGNKYYAAGEGTSWSYYAAAIQHFNLNITVRQTENFEEAKNALIEGKLVVSSQKKGRTICGKCTPYIII